MKTEEFGYDSAKHLVDSAFHPNCMTGTLSFSAIFASLGTFVENYLGIEPITGIAILLLFALEIFTGIKASLKEGKKFSSRRLWGGFLKLGIYMTILGISHLFQISMVSKPFFGFDFNIYEWLHYFFLNFTILQLFISNLENFKRLGWQEFVPAIDKISNFLKIGDKKDLKKD